jgi:hypothetical protein
VLSAPNAGGLADLQQNVSIGTRDGTDFVIYTTAQRQGGLESTGVWTISIKQNTTLQNTLLDLGSDSSLALTIATGKVLKLTAPNTAASPEGSGAIYTGSNITGNTFNRDYIVGGKVVISSSSPDYWIGGKPFDGYLIGATPLNTMVVTTNMTNERVVMGATPNVNGATSNGALAAGVKFVERANYDAKADYAGSNGDIGGKTFNSGYGIALFNISDSVTPN